MVDCCGLAAEARARRRERGGRTYKNEAGVLKPRLSFEFIFLVNFFVFGALPEVARATPQVIRVDGSVFDSAGAPLTASKDIQIKAYDAASGGSLLWTSSTYNTSVSSGRFTINLDAATGSPSLVDRLGERTASQAIYFQIEVDSGAANGSMDTPTIVLPRIRARGTAFALNASSADALKGVTATALEMNYLAGVTANVQSQINTLAVGGSSASKVDKAGDSMSGALQVGASITSTGTITAATLNSTGVTASRFAMFDSSKNLTSSASSVTDAEFGYLSGVTANLGANLNGLTANVQTQINGKQATLAYVPVSKLGDSMSGALQVGANITSTGTVMAATINATGLTASRVAVTDSSKNLSSSSVTDTELGYLSGVTSSVQTQFAGKVATTKIYGVACSAGYYLSGFDASGDKVCVALPSNITYTKIAHGRLSACAILSDTTVQCWGYNAYGQLGNGSTTQSALPVYVRTSDGDKFSGAVDISLGYASTCAVKSDGSVWCWGYNGYGGIGNGNTVSPQLAPVQVIEVTGAVKVSVGYYYACAVQNNGVAKCWGYEGYGEHGAGTIANRSTPIQVSGVTSFVNIAAGNGTTCGTKSDGTAYCWGLNGNGQLGDGTTTTRTTPVQVSGLTGVTMISTSRASTTYGIHSCALKSDGTAACWGFNGYGQLGDGTTTSRYTAAAVSGITTGTKVMVGNIFSCASLSDGTAKCWGYNGYGQLGDGTVTQRTTPTTVVSSSGSGALSGVTDISSNDGTGNEYNAGAVANGKAYSWGQNNYNQLGNNSTTDSYVPKGAFGP